ncbi:hypothetical protein AAFF_G00124030 [Aldrovandia affinis]|uniref:FYVE and coiled-coil domain-containing protein 1 n=1 Tax=Aldrovandia affinis TaxID=143900 RepID=A0AAD7W9L1_9TELE|nr:hypothetical protein AAFF_G00124030 [Aldrovandia affinis]
MINLEESKRRWRVYHNASKVFDFYWHGKQWCIDAAVEDDSLGRLVNGDHIHPNCRMKKIVADGKPHLCLFFFEGHKPQRRRKKISDEDHPAKAVETTNRSLGSKLAAGRTNTVTPSSLGWNVVNEAKCTDTDDETMDSNPDPSNHHKLRAKNILVEGTLEELLNLTDAPLIEEAGPECFGGSEHMSLADVTEVVQKLRSGKAPGVDEIRPEMLKVMLLALKLFAAEYDTVGMRVSTSKSEAMVLARKKLGGDPGADPGADGGIISLSWPGCSEKSVNDLKNITVLYGAQPTKNTTTTVKISFTVLNFEFSYNAKIASTKMLPTRLSAITDEKNIGGDPYYRGLSWAMATGESQLQRIIRDLQDAVAELTKEYRESGEPITDDSSNLHKFSYKLEYLLQFDQKEKTTFLGTRKDYWDYFSDCLAKIKGANDGIRFVKSIPELKTSLGKGRAFIRYSLVHQRLADTLQQCLMNQRITSDWYYARSPFLKPHLSVDIINHLYELNEVQFDVASRGHDLDSAWPTFARRTLGSAGSPGHLWKPPSRSSSINSLASTYSQQVQEFPCSPDFGHGLLDESGELCESAGGGGGTVDALRLELDRAELQQQELLERVQQMGGEGEELRRVVEELQAQLDTALAAHAALQRDSSHTQLRLERAESQAQEAVSLREAESRGREAESRELLAKLAATEQRNTELLSRLEGALSEKGEQTASYFDSAKKIHELLDKLNEAEKGRQEALREGQEMSRRAEQQGEELKRAETCLRESEERLAVLTASAGEESAGLRAQAEELRAAVDKLQEALTLREEEASNLQSALEAQESRAEEEERRRGGVEEALESRVRDLEEQLRARREELAASEESARGLEEEVESQAGEREALEAGAREQAKKMEEYKSQCASLVELNGRLLQTVKRNEEAARGLAEGRAALEAELAGRAQLEDGGAAADQRERALREEKRQLEQENRELREEQAAERLQEREREGAEGEEREEREAAARLSLAEAQLELHLGEVARLQGEVLELRAGLRGAAEEEAQARRRADTMEAERDELRGLAEGLTAQLEDLKRGHMQELRCWEEREHQASQELCTLKERHEKLALEAADARESLDRANTEMAELGVAVCTLTSEKEEARREAEVRREELARSEKLPEAVQDLRDRLQRAEAHARNLQESHGEEVAAVRFQMSSEAMSYQNQVKSASEVAVTLRAQLAVEQEKACDLGARVFELEAENREKSRLMEEKDSRILECDARIGQREKELERLRDSLARTEEDLSSAQKRCEQLSERLDVAVAERESHAVKMAAELDDLCRTKTNLEERLIELIRDKDELWQKSDALEFEQKLRAEEQWWLVDKEASHCLGCRSQFTWLLRKHHCRLCGRIFCYYCSNNFVMTKHSGKKERCCGDCYSQHSAVVERLTQAELGHTTPPSAPAPAPYTPTPRVTVTDPAPKPDDAAYDIITEEEVNGIYDSDSLSHTTGDSPEREQGAVQPLASTELSLGTSAGDTNPDDPEELMTTVQDAEIYLLKSGELTLSVPLTLEEIAQFGDGSRELFIKSSCYSVIPMAVSEAGPTISWVFSSEPKSISFSVVYREGPDAPLEQAKVLIPLTRCDSHKETIQGQLKARKPGTYMLIFDNSFSRFISKKVLYHLTIEKPIIYDGSDFP